MTTTTGKASKEHSISLRVTQEELDWLREHAAAEERTVANVLRQALRKYVEQNR